jgi:hypothetical protein
MKLKIFQLLLVLGLTGCREAQNQSLKTDDSNVIESTILWKAEIDPVTWEPLLLKKMLRNQGRFKQEGNFYKANVPIHAFGHEVLYIGTVGLDLIPGPNVMLKGAPEDIAKYMTEHNGIKLIKKGDEYEAELKKDIVLCIAAHPSKEGATLVIGAYFGK